MKKTMKRTLSLVLAVCLIAGLLIVPAAAASTAPVFADEGGNTFIMNGGETSVASVTFTLAAAPASDTTFALYDAETDGTALKSGVTTTDTTLTFDSLDPAIAAGTYYVSATETGNDESARTAVTVVEATTDPDPDPAPTTYAINKAAATNGSFTVMAGDPAAEVTVAAENTEITVTATADAGYEVGEITVTKDSDSSAVAVTEGKFTMPAEAVTVTVTFQEVTPATKEIALTVPAGVTVTDVTGGTLADDSSKITTTEGATVTFKLTVADGYTRGTVTGADEAEGVYTVTAAAVEITATQTVTPPTKVDLSTKTVTLKKGETMLGHESAPKVGDVLTAVVSDDIPAADVDFVWTVGGTAVADNATDTYTVTAADLGKVIKVKAKAQENSTTYEGETAETETGAVEAAPLQAITYTAQGVNVQFDGQRHAVAVDVTDPATGATVKYGETAGTYDLDAAPASFDVVDKTVYFQITADGYETATGSVKLTVAKADAPQITLSASPSGVPAEGGEVTFTVAGVPEATNVAPTIACGVDGAIALTKQSDGTFTGTHTIAAATEAKTHTVTLTWADGNYEAIGEVKCVVEQLAPGQVDKTALTAKYNEVKTAVEAATVAENGDDVLTSAKWITSANKALADTALGEVKDVIDNTNATAEDVTAALAKLTTVEGYLQPGTKVPEATKYNVSVTDGTADKATAAETEKVTVTADAAPAGKVFDKWTATGLTLSAADEVANPLTFAMPAGDVALTATYKDETVVPADPAVKNASIVFITDDNYADYEDIFGARPDHDIRLPWLLVKYERNEAGTVTFAVTKNGQAVSFGTGATLSFEAAAANPNAWVSFHMVSQAETDHAGQDWLDQTDAEGEYAVTVTLNGDNATATATYAEAPDPNAKTITFTVPTGVTVTDLSDGTEDLTLDNAGKVTVDKDATVTFKLTVSSSYTLGTVTGATEAEGVYTVDADAETVTITATKNSTSGGRPSSRPSGGNDTTTTDKKTETLTDGTKRTTETAKDGTVTVTDTKPDGTKTATTTTPAGEVTTTVTLGRDTESVQVCVPMDDANSGMVAVIVKADGTEEIIRDSVVVDDEVIFDLDENATVKIVNNAKSFVDMPGHWAQNDVDFVSARDLFNGVDANHFAPDATMTRGMMATVLFRLDGETKGEKNVDFSDVTAGDWFAEAVDWASQEGVINGYTDGSFGPNRSITREELVVMIYRYAGAPEVDAAMGMAGFDDVDQISTWAETAMHWAVQNGIINGKSASTIDPKGNATRAEVSAVLQRYVKLAK